MTSAPRSLDTPLIMVECTAFVSWKRHADPPGQAGLRPRGGTIDLSDTGIQ